MGKSRTRRLSAEEQQAIIAELNEKGREIQELVSRISFFQNEIVLYKTMQNVDFYENEVGIVGVQYVAQSDEAFEVKVAEELYERLYKTIDEWRQWVAEQLKPDEQVPF